MPRTISVVIPTYNRASYIVEAIESVLEQDIPQNYELEVIVVDDGSTDETEAILTKKFKDKILYHKIPNSGRPAVPRNIGLSLASGELIAFQDSDDIWAPQKLVTQLPAFNDKEVMLSYGKAEFMSSNNTNEDNPVVRDLNPPEGDIFNTLVHVNVVSTLTVMVRKSVLKSVGTFDESLAVRGVEDYGLWLRVAAKFKVSYIDQTLAYYRRHDENISLSLDANNDIHLYKLYLQLSKNSVFTTLQRIALYQRLIALNKHSQLQKLKARTVLLWLRIKNKLL